MLEPSYAWPHVAFSGIGEIDFLVLQDRGNSERPGRKCRPAGSGRLARPGRIGRDLKLPPFAYVLGDKVRFGNRNIEL